MATKTVFAKAGMVAASVIAGGLMVAGLSVMTSAPANANDWDSAPAQSQAEDGSKKGPKCLDIRQAGGFHVVDEKTLMVRDAFGNAYLLDVGGPCRSMSDLSNFGFEVQGTDQICRAHDAKLLYSNSGERPVKCLINGIKAISRAEADALEED